MSKSKGLTIPGEVADQITLANLIDYRDYLKKEIDDHATGSYLHADDLISNREVIPALNLIIKHFGGEKYGR